jgi:chemotaxis protein methyltransferase CheR
MEQTITGGNIIRIGDRDFSRLTDFLRSQYGINLSKKRTLVEGRLNNYLVQRGFSDYGSYLDMLFRDPGGAEMNNILNYLTTNYSYFMREWSHFNYYQDQVLPQMAQSVRDRDLRVWSAGCSTGEEPYTIAILNKEFFADSPGWDTQVLATDISMKVLGKAEQGIYEEEALDKVPAQWKNRYFARQSDGSWQVRDALRREVTFRRFNLNESTFPFRRRFHVIFCRNVMIYFDAEKKKQLIRRFYDALEPGGYLFIGQSESIDRSEVGFSYVMPSVFRKDGDPSWRRT